MVFGVIKDSRQEECIIIWGVCNMKFNLNFVFYCSIAVTFFAIGLLIGYLNTGVNNSEIFKSITIPFLSMLGSWFAGLGAFAAVGVSLILALQAKKENIEEVSISSFIGVRYGSDIKHVVVNVTNRKKIRSQIISIALNFSLKPDVDIHITNEALERTGSQLPIALVDHGELASFFIDSSFGNNLRLMQQLNSLFGDGELGDGEISVHTTTKKFRLRMPPRIQEYYDSTYRKFLADKNEEF